MIFDTVVKDGEVVTGGRVERAHVGIQDGKITAISHEPIEGAIQIDAKDCAVLPGAIDAHVHFQPRRPDKEGIKSFIEWSDDFYSGSISAACGGVTTFIDFAVQDDALQGRANDAVDAYIDIASDTSAIDFALHAGLTQASDATLEEIPELVERGVTSFKFFRTYRRWGVFTDLGFMYAAFPILAELGAVAAVHCEDDEILTYLRNKFITEGHEFDLRYHARSRPSVAEEISIDQVAALSREFGTRAYPVHLSSARGLSAVRRAKANGDLWCEAGLHFLLKNESVFDGPDADLHFMTPPFRPQSDVDALWEGLADGSIDWVATDHSPHLAAEKRRDPKFSPSEDGLEFSIPPGFTGVEEMLPLLYTHGVAGGRFSIVRLAELLATNPAATLGLSQKGSIEVGKDADIVIYDPSVKSTIDIDRLHTRADYTIYQGMEVVGQVRDTLSRGVQVVVDGQFQGQAGQGRFVKRDPR